MIDVLCVCRTKKGKIPHTGLREQKVCDYEPAILMTPSVRLCLEEMKALAVLVWM